MSEQTAQFLIRDSQGNVYGPASLTTLREWVQQGRIVPGMDIAPRDSRQWVEVTSHPELADLFDPSAPAVAADEHSIGQASPPAAPAQPAPFATPSTQPQPALDLPHTPVTRSMPATTGYQPAESYPTPVVAAVNVPALIGLIVGLIGLLAFMCVCMSLPLGAIATLLSGIGFVQIRRNPQVYTGSGIAIAGLVIGILDIMAGLGIILLMVLSEARP